MAYELEPIQIEEINNTLPPQFALLKDKYPLSIYNVANHWNFRPFPEGYVPEFIDIYYKDEDILQADISIKSGKLVYVELEDTVTDPSLIYMTIEDEPAYVQIEGKVIFNRLGGAVLPDVAINLDMMLQSILNGIYA